LIACISVTCVLVWTLDEPDPPAVKGAGWAGLLSGLLNAKRSGGFWWALAFAATSAAGFEAVGAMAGPFLIDRGVSEDAIGWFFAVAVVIATVAGGLIGGYVSDRLGRRRTVGAFLGCFVLVIVGVAALDLTLGSEVAGFVWIALLTVLYLCIGLFVAASYALFMDAIDPRYGGTQFSACMSATNGCESWSAWAGGQLAGRFGYAVAFLAMSTVSVLSLGILKKKLRTLD
jgi:MFS transporter (putative signal transducer)